MSRQKKILIVDDDPNILEVLEARLTAVGFQVFKSSDASGAIRKLEEEQIDLLISDVKMPEISGKELFAEVHARYPFLPVIFLTAYGTIPDAVTAVKAGAVDYLTKPFDGRMLVKKIHTVLALEKSETADTAGFIDNGFFWGKSPAMQNLRALTKKVAASNVNVLVLGESGVGKEGIAQAIHNNSLRKDKPYVVVDCGSTPAGILESELFGHIKGAFTNALQDKVGLIEAADSGTLFLDEIGNISADMQSRLLRFLEDRKIRRVGDVKERMVDCRVVSATNANLQADIEAGTFRQDLFFRLKVVTLNIPPLRERKLDIPDLARFFVEKYCREQNLQSVEITGETVEWFKKYSWPGNVRELKNSLEAGIVLCRNNRMELGDLQLTEMEGSPFQTGNSEKGFSIQQSEKEAIIRALKKTNGVQKHAAELLDISRRSIHYKIKKYNIQVSNYK